METPDFLEKLASQFGNNTSVKNVFGEPVQAGDKIIIPVAQIAYGLGGGYGQGTKKGKPEVTSNSDHQDGEQGEGAGGGGGMFAKPKGVYEISPKGTQFIPAMNTKHILVGIAIGFILKGLLHPGKKQRAK